MSRFMKLTHVLWHCQYHLVWVSKYRYRVLKGEIGREVHNCVQVFCSQLGLYGGGAECAGGSYAFAGEGSTKAFDVEADGCCERLHGAEVVHELSVFT